MAWSRPTPRASPAKVSAANIEIIGSPEQVVQQLQALKAAGIDGVQIGFPDFATASGLFRRAHSAAAQTGRFAARHPGDPIMSDPNHQQCNSRSMAAGAGRARRSGRAARSRVCTAWRAAVRIQSSGGPGAAENNYARATSQRPAWCWWMEQTAQAAQLTGDLRARGYSDAHYLEDGLPGWVESGFQSTFSVSAPQFTTQVWKKFGTPAVQASELHELYQGGADVVVLDSRTVEEYARGHVPRAISGTGRGARSALRRPRTVSGNTRSGFVCRKPAWCHWRANLAQCRSTEPCSRVGRRHQGWQKAGLELEVGLQRTFGPVSGKAAQLGERWATRLEREFAVKSIDSSAVARWVGEGDHLTTYLLDVRTPQEYDERHIPGSVSAPGGQLILGHCAMLPFVAARLVLIDDTGSGRSQRRIGCDNGVGKHACTDWIRRWKRWRLECSRQLAMLRDVLSIPHTCRDRAPECRCCSRLRQSPPGFRRSVPESCSPVCCACPCRRFRPLRR